MNCKNSVVIGLPYKKRYHLKRARKIDAVVFVYLNIELGLQRRRSDAAFCFDSVSRILAIRT